MVLAHRLAVRMVLPGVPCTHSSSCQGINNAMFVIVYNYESKYVLYLKTVFFFQICTKTFVFGD